MAAKTLCKQFQFAEKFLFRIYGLRKKTFYLEQAI